MSRSQTRKFIAALAAILALITFCAAASAGEIPTRIVSLAPNLTEILFALGLGQRLVGVTTFCDYPEEARKIKKIGGMSNPSLEAVVSLKPDIVMMTTDGNQKEFAERLRTLKIRTYVFRARRLSDLPQGVREVGSALGVEERADSLSQEMEVALNTFRFKSTAVKKKRALFIIWPEPLIAAGRGTVIDDAMTLLGLENVAAGSKASYPKYSIEEILRQSPDLIIVGRGHADMEKVSAGLLKRLEILPAVRNRRVFYVSDDLYRLGPRTLRGMREIAVLRDQ